MPETDQLTCIGGPHNGKTVPLDRAASTFTLVRQARLLEVSLIAAGEYAPTITGDMFEYVRARDGGFEALVPSRDEDLQATWRTMLEENRGRGRDHDDLADDLIARFLHAELARRGLPTSVGPQWITAPPAC